MSELGTLPLIQWQKRAYAQLCYAFMLRATIDWHLWGSGWDVIERAPAEVKPVLPCEPNWRALPTWARWWCIDGDGTIRAFHLKPMGNAGNKHWFMGNYGPVQSREVEMVAGHLASQDSPQVVHDWYMTLRRRPFEPEPDVEEPEPVSKPKKKSKKKKKEITP